MEGSGITIAIRTYQPNDDDQLITLFDEFQQYLAALDPLKRMRRLPGYGERALRATLSEVAAKEGIFCIAAAADRIVGFAVGIITRSSGGELLTLVPSTRGRIT
jgi:hypothetical protein